MQRGWILSPGLYMIMVVLNSIYLFGSIRAGVAYARYEQTGVGIKINSNVLFFWGFLKSSMVGADKCGSPPVGPKAAPWSPMDR